MILYKKKISLKILPALLLLLTCLPVFADEAINLFTNSDFEVDTDLNGKPDCWGLITNYPSDYYLDDTNSAFGNVSIKMETYCHPSTPQHTYTYGSSGVYQLADIEPNTTYTISIYCKTERPDKVKALINTWESDANGSGLGQHFDYISLSSTWQRVAYTFTTYPTAIRAKVVLAVRASFDETVCEWKGGEFYTSWVDGVQFEDGNTVSPFHVTFSTCTPTLGTDGIYDVIVSRKYMYLGYYGPSPAVFDISNPVEPNFIQDSSGLAMEGWNLSWSLGRLFGEYIAVPSLSHLNIINVPRDSEGIVGPITAKANLCASPVFISGYIQTPNSLPVEGVLVSADNGGGSDITSETGFYEVEVCSGWSGIITPEDSCWMIDPSSFPYANVVSNQSNQNYIATYVCYQLPDLNMDGKVNFLDLRVFCLSWPNTDCYITNDWCKKADINRNSVVNLADFALLAENWLTIFESEI